jgi:hypothetical protein
MPFHLTVAKNGGPPSTGAISCTWSDTIRLRLNNTASVRSARFEVYGFPAGWATPVGWSEDATSRVYYSEALEPPDFSLPTEFAGLWGKWLLRVLVNGASADDTSALEIVSPVGLHALPAGEDKQFGGAAQVWGKHLEENLRILNNLLVGGGVGSDELWGTSVDGDRSETAGGIATTITQPRFYKNLTLGNATSLSMGGYRLHGSDTLTVGEDCVLHNDGGNSVGQSAGGGAAAGELALAAVGGVNGAAINSAGSGSAANAASPAVGGAGGAGGASNVQPGGSASTVTLTVTSHGIPWSRMGLEWFVCIFAGTTWNKFRGGAGGAGGGGSLSGVGGGGGGNGGLGWIRFKHIVNNGRISCRGGNGGPGGTNAGGGGGGGGGLLVIWCETWTGNPPDCNGGQGGAGNGGGVSGSQGSPGKVLVFVKGTLKFRSGFGANAPDFNDLT